MKTLLISNSTNPGESYLEHCIEQIGKTLEGKTRVLFIPYAAVTFSFSEYERMVQEKFSRFGIEVQSIHHFGRAKRAVQEAEAIVIGGGNTFRLLKLIQQNELIEALRYKVLDGAPYVGWSAGANVACPTICTTNDMPITEPDNLSAINLVRFQINPHYLDVNPAGHGGETREERILEYLEMDPYVYVVGLREGSMLEINKGNIHLLGKKSARIFKHGTPAWEILPGDDIDFLFE
jgi:dipeptidase E